MPAGTFSSIRSAPNGSLSTVESISPRASKNPTIFPVDGKRVLFYLFFDGRGIVDDYVVYKLERLRPFAQHIVVIVNGFVTDAGRKRLEAVADDVFERENVGYDVWGYKAGLDRFGHNRLAEFDELILMNYTWFGPVRSFEPIFEMMDAAEIDYWGMTDHAAVTPNPVTMTGTMPSHIQSHWIAVRRPMFDSAEWRQYWRDMPRITSYNSSILNHESRFTGHFEGLGFKYLVAFPHDDFPGTLHPAFERAQVLIEHGCPVLKRRPFFHDPLYLDREAIIGRWLIDAATAEGYPEELVWQNMARNAAPKILNTNASMLEILPEVESGYDESRPFAIAAIVHVFYEDMIDELLDRVTTLPTPFDLYITTTDDAKAEHIRGRVTARNEPLVKSLEIRVLPSNRGRDLSAFFIGVKDVLRRRDYDLIVKIHSKKTVQQGASAGYFFKRHQLDNLLNSKAYASNLLALFQREKGLGVAFPPTVHIGYPTLGGAWFGNREPTKELCERLGIRVPLDDISPLAPMGAMWIGRPEAMALLTDIEWAYDEYQSEAEHGDGSLAHVQERIVAYAAAELGFHSRTVMNAEFAAISHTFLEYKLDRLSNPVQGYAIDEARVVRENADDARHLRGQGHLGYLKNYFIHFHPRSVRTLIAIYRPLRAIRRRVRSAGKRSPEGFNI